MSSCPHGSSRAGGLHRTLVPSRRRPMLLPFPATQHTPTPMNDRFLEGRTALVTGSTSGIGLAIARALAAHGARVAVNGLGDDGQIASAVQAVRDAGAPDARHFDADLRDPDQIDAMMSAIAAWSPIDVLVNNAGIHHAVPPAQMPAGKWNDIIAINLSSAFHTMRLAMPGMAERGYGRV